MKIRAIHACMPASHQDLVDNCLNGVVRTDRGLAVYTKYERQRLFVQRETAGQLRVYDYTPESVVVESKNRVLLGTTGTSLASEDDKKKYDDLSALVDRMI